MTISTITIGAVAYTSYASVAEADAYLAADISSSALWAAQTSDAKKAALISATRTLSRMDWSGEPAGADAFPRTGLTDKEGRTLTDADVPQAVQDACCALAARFAASPSSASPAEPPREVKKLAAGTTKVEYFKGARSYLTQGSAVPPHIRAMLADLLSGSGVLLSAVSKGVAEECICLTYSE